ncbi:MAG: translation initiation factor IF-3 [Patescibacteria group bacterium]
MFLNYPRVNNQIRASQVRLVAEDGKNLGIFSLEDALHYARERNLDLIEITDKTQPPICKIGEIGKYLYHQQKKERHQKLRQKVGKVKGVRMSPRISEHDLEIKANLATKFLSKGNKVRIEIRLRGREKALSNFAMRKLEELLQKIEANTKIKRDEKIKRNPRGMEILVSKG